jgi:cell division protease FtsH
LLAARRNKRIVTAQEFEDAKDKVLMGAERRSFVMSEEEKRNTAFHEAGHALLALTVPNAHPVHKATIIPRGRALGMVMQLPERDEISMSYEQMTSRLAIMMGGRVAEELTFGEKNVTSGASSDIEQATNLARAMVTRWGYSEKLGKVAYGENQQEVFLGHSVTQQKNVSEETSQIIDVEIRRLVDEAYDVATVILKKRKKGLKLIAEGLLEYETLSGKEIADLLEGNPLSRDIGDDAPPSRGSSVPTSGTGKPKKDGKPDSGGMEPQPQ